MSDGELSSDEKQDSNLTSKFCNGKSSENEENESSDAEHDKETQEDDEEEACVPKKSSKRNLREKSNKNDSLDISEEMSGQADDVNDQVSTKSDKRLARKRTHEKSKRAQLLKNNSKQLRLASMAEGLDEGLFSKYKVLTSKQTLLSPER